MQGLPRIALALEQLQPELRRLRSKLAALHEESAAAPLNQKCGTRLLLAMREWEPTGFTQLRRTLADRALYRSSSLRSNHLEHTGGGSPVLPATETAAGEVYFPSRIASFSAFIAPGTRALNQLQPSFARSLKRHTLPFFAMHS